MEIQLKIDRGIYLVDDGSRTYRFLRRNPDWRRLDPMENATNKRHIDGYRRIFRNGLTRVYHYRGQ